MADREQPTVGDDDASEVDEHGRNLTQQRLDEDLPDSRPVDFGWEEPSGEPLPPGEVDDREAEARRAD